MAMSMGQLDMPVKSVPEYEKAAKPQKETPKAVELDISDSNSVNKGKDTGAGDEDDKKIAAKGGPSKGSLESAFSGMNKKLKMQRTRCEYNYDEETKRVSIKVYDKDTDELVLEAPPEETLEAIKKAWELAGIIVDKKF